MFENFILQASGDNLTYILGLIGALVGAAVTIFRQYNSGQFAKQRLNETGMELRDALASEATARQASESLTCITAQLIIANNDGKIDQKEYDQIVATARNELIKNGRNVGLDIEEIVKTAEALLIKKAA